MKELVEAIVGESYAAAPKKIVEGLPEALAHREISGAPRTIYAELWHICFWLDMSLEWMHGIEAPYPASTEVPFPLPEDIQRESWMELCVRFAVTLDEAAELARDSAVLAKHVVCTSRPGEALRTMTVEEQLISAAAHNAYHLGRIVLMRQLLGAWPPPSGGFNW